MHPSIPSKEKSGRQVCTVAKPTVWRIHIYCVAQLNAHAVAGITRNAIAMFEFYIFQLKSDLSILIFFFQKKRLYGRPIRFMYSLELLSHFADFAFILKYMHINKI